jgi:hypothetical protein
MVERSREPQLDEVFLIEVSNEVGNTLQPRDLTT